jgi:hypothetical protein
MKIWLFCCLSSVLLFMGSVQAGAGHDHDTPETPTNTVVNDTPRLVMSSGQFELVGIAEGKSIHLYLDDFATNAPIPEASIELEIAGEQLKAEEEGDGTYHITLEHALTDGVHAVLATILTASASDLLTGELDFHVEEEKQEEAPQGIRITPLQLIIVSAIISVFLLLFIIVIRRDAHRREHTS